MFEVNNNDILIVGENGTARVYDREYVGVSDALKKFRSDTGEEVYEMYIYDKSARGFIVIY